MKSAMLSAQDMDEVIDLHEKFLDLCLKECLLASQGIKNIDFKKNKKVKILTVFRFIENIDKVNDNLFIIC